MIAVDVVDADAALQRSRSFPSEEGDLLDLLFNRVGTRPAEEACSASEAIVPVTGINPAGRGRSRGGIS